MGLPFRRRQGYTWSSMGFHCAGKSGQVVVAATTAVGRSVTTVTVTAGGTGASIVSRFPREHLAAASGRIHRAPQGTRHATPTRGTATLDAAPLGISFVAVSS